MANSLISYAVFWFDTSRPILWGRTRCRWHIVWDRLPSFRLLDLPRAARVGVGPPCLQLTQKRRHCLPKHRARLIPQYAVNQRLRLIGQTFAREHRLYECGEITAKALQSSSAVEQFIQ